MKTSLIIHGHFYQPPRENPYTGIVPDQVTAYPHENWNEATYRTCYEPNACSRYLDNNGKVLQISNNYSIMSCNFGPTLLSWLDEAHPDFSEKLTEAHKESISRLGHSNFIAQCYNHVILPLQKPYIQKIQIKWALDDYRMRFKTDAEGFWCSECAITKSTIDFLAMHKIKFVVLSPWQASSINGVKLNGKPAPCDRPFIIKGEKRQIAAFFYDPELASGISFGHYLTDADKLFKRLKEIRKERKNPKLITCATDGEIYGHHEPFGDMAFAALTKKVAQSLEFEFTNYGAYLEKNPATEIAELWEGEDSKGSSWSCEHGVGRWYRNCGCHTGGSDKWNQKWRTALRNAFDNLEEKSFEIYRNNIEKIFGGKTDCIKLLESYSSVLCGKRTVPEFVSSLKDNNGNFLSDTNCKDIAKLLDGMKNIMFMYTSCGWFFNDISGIEPRQNISYAIYAANVFSQFSNINLRTNLLNDLSEAKSNIPAEGNGEDIAKRDMMKIPSFVQAAGYFALNRKLSPKIKAEKYGIYNLIDINDFSVKIQNTRTLENLTLRYNAAVQDGNTFAISVKNTATGYSYRYTLADVESKTLREIASWVDSSLTSGISIENVLDIFRSLDKYIMLLQADRSFASNGKLAENIAFSFRALKAQKDKVMQATWNKDMIRRLAQYTKASLSKEAIATATAMFNDQLDYYALMFRKAKISEKSVSHMIDFIKAVREAGFNCDITQLQNQVYPYIKGIKTSKVEPETIKKLALEINFSV